MEVIHIFKGKKEKAEALKITKFEKREFMWIPKVCKVREERVFFFLKKNFFSN